MTTLAERLGIGVTMSKWNRPLKNRPDIPEITSDTLIGLEIEVEQAIMTGAPLEKVWTITNDGSLRNNGAEFVSRPIRASAAPSALVNLMEEVLDRNHAAFTMRTSIHVHMNVLDMTLEQYQAVVLLYSVFEPLFYQYAGRGRWKNIYCVPITETTLLNGFVRRQLRTQWLKYTGLNLRRVGDLGTIEFRHLAGTEDVARICNWINLITTLKEYVLSRGAEATLKMISGLSPDADIVALAREVFGEYADLLAVTNFEALQRSIPMAQTAFADHNELPITRESPIYILARSRKIPGLIYN